MLLPSTITALRTRRYTSTLYIHRTIHGVGYNPYGWRRTVQFTTAVCQRLPARTGQFTSAAYTWGDVQRWDDGSGRITVVRSKTNAEAQGATVAITPAAVDALTAIRPVGAGDVRVFGLSESQIARRVKAIAKAAGLEGISGPQRASLTGRMAQWRPHPRDRAPGPLKAGRPHGRPLHPRRVRRVRYL